MVQTIDGIQGYSQLLPGAGGREQETLHFEMHWLNTTQYVSASYLLD